MTRTREERVRGTLLRLLDFSRVEAQALEVAQKERDPSEKPLTGMQATFAPYAAARKSDGTVVVVCSEGVGWEVTDDKPFSLALYARGDGWFSVMPSYEAQMTPRDLQEYLTDETVDLADLVRTFGQRLESNFWLLRNLLGEQS